MSTTEQKTFDWPAFRRAYERLDSDAVRGLVTDDVEFIEIDSKTPPSSPLIVRGADDLAALIDEVAKTGIEHEVQDALVGDDKVAIRSECRYPDGKKVAQMAMLEIEDGRVRRLTEVQAFDE
jgi:ketosteroid isomerase-like protein